jgi:hypothetical protein
MSYDANWRVLCPCTFENIERAAKKVPSIKDISCGPPDDEGRLELHPTLTGTDKFVEIWANPFGPFATDVMVYSNTAENREAFVEAAVAAQELAEAMGLILESDDDGEDEADIELGEAREGEFPDPETPPSLDAFEANHLLDSNVDEWDTAVIVAINARGEELRRLTLDRARMLQREHPLLWPHGRALSGVRAFLIQRLQGTETVQQQRASFDAEGHAMTVITQPVGGPL